MNYLQGLGGGGGGGGQTSSAKSTAQTIFGGYNSNAQLATIAPWLIGGAAIVAIAIAVVLIAAIRGK
jgi:hypothetical protein